MRRCLTVWHFKVSKSTALTLTLKKWLCCRLENVSQVFPDGPQILGPLELKLL